MFFYTSDVTRNANFRLGGEAAELFHLVKYFSPTVLCTTRSLPVFFNSRFLFLGIMVGAFILCYLPIIVMLLRQATHGLEPTASQAILFLSFTNTLINPIIYCLRSRVFRKAFHNLRIKDSGVISDCIASKRSRRTSKVTKSEHKQECRAPGIAKVDNNSELSTTSTSYSFVISRALFQTVLSEVLEDGNC